MATSVDAVRLSSDYLVTYFQASGRSDSMGYEDIYQATRSAETPFGRVTSIVGGGINTPDKESFPTVSGDGLTLVFGRQVADDTGARLYYAIREQTYLPFASSALVPGLGEAASSYDVTPFVREDGEVLYFASTRASPESTGIFRASFGSAGASTPSAVVELNTGFGELAPVVTPDDLVIYYASGRYDGGALGQYDVWMATRSSTTEPFSLPLNVSEVNSPQWDTPTFVTRDRCTLYFSSTRDGTLSPYVATKTP